MPHPDLFRTVPLQRQGGDKKQLSRGSPAHSQEGTDQCGWKIAIHTRFDRVTTNLILSETSPLSLHFQIHPQLQRRELEEKISQSPQQAS